MRVIECEQGSPEWLAARAGRITASRMADVLCFIKNGKDEGQKRKDYRTELVAERLSGMAVDKFVSHAMREGSRLEPEACMEYEYHHCTELEHIGFVLHPDLDFSGASPDGLIGSDGGLEVKCPTMTTHVEWMLAGIVPPEYEPQMAWNMACCERQWWDFISYNPSFPGPMSRFVIRLHRDEKRIQEILDSVIGFNDSVNALIGRLDIN